MMRRAEAYVESRGHHPNTHYKCPFSALTRKLNVLRTLVDMDFSFFFWYVELVPKVYFRISVTIYIISAETIAWFRCVSVGVQLRTNFVTELCDILFT
jgi:hypothetical protein